MKKKIAISTCIGCLLFLWWNLVFSANVSITQQTYYSSNGQIEKESSQSCGNSSQWTMFSLQADTDVILLGIDVSILGDYDLVSSVSIESKLWGEFYGISSVKSNKVHISIDQLELMKWETKELIIRTESSCSKIGKYAVEIDKLIASKPVWIQITDSYTHYTKITSLQATPIAWNDVYVKEMKFSDAEQVATLSLCLDIAESSSNSIISFPISISNSLSYAVYRTFVYFESSYFNSCKDFTVTYAELGMKSNEKQTLSVLLNEGRISSFAEWNMSNNVFSTTYAGSFSVSTAPIELKRANFPNFSSPTGIFSLCNLSHRTTLNRWPISVKVYNLTKDLGRKKPYELTFNHNWSLDKDACLQTFAYREQLWLTSAWTYTLEANVDTSLFPSKITVLESNQKVTMYQSLDDQLKNFADLYISERYDELSKFTFNVCNRGWKEFSAPVNIQLYNEDVFSTDIRDWYVMKQLFSLPWNTCKKYSVEKSDIPAKSKPDGTKNMAFSIYPDTVVVEEYNYENNRMRFVWDS